MFFVTPFCGLPSSAYCAIDSKQYYPWNTHNALLVQEYGSRVGVPGCAEAYRIVREKTNSMLPTLLE